MEHTDKEKVAYVFAVLRATRTPIMTFAKYTGITRATLHRWKRGANVNDSLRLNIAVSQAAKLLKAKREKATDLKERMKLPWGV